MFSYPETALGMYSDIEMVFTFVAVDVFLLLLFFIWFLIFKSYIERFIVIECVLFLL